MSFTSDLNSRIAACLKQEDYSLRLSVRGWAREIYKDLPASIHGLIYRDVAAYLKAFTYEGLPGEIYPIQPEDLPGYLKVWPMDHLSSIIRGWQKADLQVFIDWNDMRQLSAYIGMHPPKDLTALIKGWVREATLDLSGWIRAYQYEGLPGYIRGTYIQDFPAYIFCIDPGALQGIIHGWQEADLPANIYGRYGPNDLQAYINVVGEPRDIAGYLKAMRGVEIPADLNAYVNPATILMQQENLYSYLAAHAPGNLPASLTVDGAARGLPAFIYPKMIYMTTALSVSTMEHSNMGAVINFVCRSSGYKNLGATIDFSYLANLVSTITGKAIPVNQTDLAATVGYAANYVHMDKIPVSLAVGSGYQIEDKIQILLNIYKQKALLNAAITGTYMYNDMGATITSTWLEEYEFDNVKSRELVYDLNHAREINWYEIVEMYFKSIVPDYFYTEGEGKVYKTDRTDRWVLELASFVPEDVVLNIRRKLHRSREIYDLTKFSNMDEAIRHTINYVTSYDYGNLSSVINASGGFLNLACYVIPKYLTEQAAGLSASLTAQDRTFVLGFDDRVEFI